MKVVKEYEYGKTKIRIHDDYIIENEQKNIKEIIVSLVINHIKNKNI